MKLYIEKLFSSFCFLVIILVSLLKNYYICGMYERFDIGMDVVCIKDCKTLKSGRVYHIGACGDLMYVTNKTGLGFGIEDNWSKEYLQYYFSEDEMGEYFITTDEDFKMVIRDKKINSIIGEK